MIAGAAVGVVAEEIHTRSIAFTEVATSQGAKTVLAEGAVVAGAVALATMVAVGA